jgi:DNA-binding CsgD family transcriptional regulator
MSTTLEFPVADIRIDSESQVRATLDDTVIAAYADLMQAGVTFPPITMFDDGATYHLADGAHRVRAAMKIGRPTLTALVLSGGWAEAFWHGLGANRAHGLQMTEPDKQHAVAIALRTWPEKMQREIAAQVGCSASLVSRVATTLDAANNTGIAPEDRGRVRANREKRDAVRAMVEAGVPSTEIKNTLHAHTSIIAEVRRELGVTTIDYSRKGDAVRAPDRSRVHPRRDEIVAAVQAGKGSNDICRELGVRPELVANVRRDLGVGRPRISPTAVRARHEQIKTMAANGYTTRQIAAEVGVSPDAIRGIRHRLGFTIPADAIVAGTHHHDANRIVSRIVMDAQNIVAGTNLINYRELDRTQLAEWVQSLQESRAALGAFIKRLLQEHSHEAA